MESMSDRSAQLSGDVSAAHTNGLPLPSAELMWRVAGTPDSVSFLDGGQRSLRDLELALRVLDRTLASYGRILDFGCGCGRTMRWMHPLAEHTALHGTDVDERAIRWAARNLPYASFEVNAELPPLPYPDHHFDLVYSHSVFTHLDERHQDQWLEELKRVTSPGGHLVITMHGPNALLKISNDLRAIGEDPQPLHEALEKDGILFLKDDAWVGGPFPDSYHSTVHTPSYLFEHWGQVFFVRAYLPQGSLGFQDVVVLERLPDDTPTPARLLRYPEPRDDGARPAPPASPRAATFRGALGWVRQKYGARAGHLAGTPAATQAPASRHEGLNETTQREILRSMGERISRLESDVLKMIDSHDVQIAHLLESLPPPDYPAALSAPASGERRLQNGKSVDALDSEELDATDRQVGQTVVRELSGDLDRSANELKPRNAEATSKE